MKVTKTCICEWCHVSFESRPDHPGRFCSAQCRSIFGARQPKHRKIPAKRIDKTCEICGAIYNIHQSQDAGNRRSRYCSKECRYKAISLMKRGAGNQNYRGGKVFRGPNWGEQSRAAKTRDGHKCAICGRKQRKGERWILGVHHIKPYREFKDDWESANQLHNLITLCKSCHAKVEWGNFPCPQCLF